MGCIGVITQLLAIDPIFQRDIQVRENGDVTTRYFGNPDYLFGAFLGLKLSLFLPKWWFPCDHAKQKHLSIGVTQEGAPP